MVNTTAVVTLPNVAPPVSHADSPTRFLVQEFQGACGIIVFMGREVKTHIDSRFDPWLVIISVLEIFHYILHCMLDGQYSYVVLPPIVK